MEPVRVVFVCLGNSCRSPMAEGFARHYGSDVIDASSAGLAPANRIQPLTRKVMLDKNIDLSAYYPKTLAEVALGGCDLIVNMSGQKLMAVDGAATEEWTVRDPVGESEEVYIEVREEIERRVMALILRLRNTARRIGFANPLE